MARSGMRRPREEGAVAVEFALILPLLVMILVGTIEFGRVYSQYQVFQAGAREGARCAAVKAGGFTTCEIMQRTIDGSTPYAPTFPGGAPKVTINGVNAYPGGCTNDDQGNDVKVFWEQPLSLNIPFVPGGGAFSATIEGVFRCE